MTHNDKDQGEAIAKAIRALFMKSDFQTIINSDQMFKNEIQGRLSDPQFEPTIPKPSNWHLMAGRAKNNWSKKMPRSTKQRAPNT